MSTELKFHHKSVRRRLVLCSRKNGYPSEGRGPNLDSSERPVVQTVGRAHQALWLIAITLNFNSTSLNERLVSCNNQPTNQPHHDDDDGYRARRGGNYVTRKLHVTQRFTFFPSCFPHSLSSNPRYFCFGSVRFAILPGRSSSSVEVPVVLIKYKFTFA